MLKSSILTSFVRKPKVFNSVAIPAPSIRPQTRPVVLLSVPPAARGVGHSLKSNLLCKFRGAAAAPRNFRRKFQKRYAGLKTFGSVALPPSHGTYEVSLRKLIKKRIKNGSLDIEKKRTLTNTKSHVK